MQVVENLIAMFTGNTAGYEAAVATVQRANLAVAQSVQSAINSVSSVGRSAVGAIAAVGVSLSGVSLLRNTVGLAAGAEATTAAFETMLGSAERAREMVASLQRFADTTPLRMPGVTQAARTMMAFGVSAENILPMLRTLGDVALGDDQRLQHLAYAFGEVVQLGHLTGRTLMMMATSGNFNPLQELSRTTGRALPELQEAMHRGQISVQQVADAFASATSAGGRFNGAMARQAQTLTGLWSTAMDNVAGVARTVGNDIIEQFRLKDLVRGLSDVAQSAKVFVQGLGPNFKLFAAALAGAAVGAVALSVAFYGLTTYGAMLFNPVAAAVAVVATGLAVLVARAGGVREAWAQASGVLSETWDTVRQALAPVVTLLGDFAAGFGLVAFGALTMAGQVAEAMTGAAAGVGGFLARNRELFVIAGAVTAVVVLAALAIKAFSVAAGIAAAVVSATGVVQVVNTVIWLGWTGAVVAAKLATLAWAGVMVLAKIAMLGYAVGAGIATAAVTLLNIALGTTMVLAAPIVIVGMAFAFLFVAAAVAAVTVAAVAVAAAVSGAVAAAGAFLAFLRDIPTATGPLAVIGGMFAEWGGILGDVWSAFSVNSGAAMELLVAGFRLAWEQVKQVTEPVWDFMQAGFLAAVDVIGKVFTAEWDRVWARAKLRAEDFFLFVTSGGTRGVAGGLQAGLDKIDAIAAGQTQAALASATDAVQSAMDAFDAAMASGDNAAVQAARRRINDIKWAIAEAGAGPAGAEEPEWLRRLRGQFDAVGGAARRTAHEVKQLEATAFGSAEHATRVQHYLDTLAGMGSAGAGSAAPGATPSVASPAAPAAAPGGGSSPATGGSGGSGATSADARAVVAAIDRLYNLLANGGFVVATEDVE